MKVRELLTKSTVFAAIFTMLTTCSPVTSYADGFRGGHHGGGYANTPEVPYAAIFPAGLIGMTVLVYRRKKKNK